MDAESLKPFFSPKGVAVVGASQDPTKLGYGLSRNLVQSNFQGVVHFVNPRGGGLLGRLMYPSILETPDPVDLAILLIPAKSIPQALRECGKRGIQAVIIAAGGFREIGPEGADLENKCLSIAQSYGMRLMGPNSVGLLDTHLPMDATFLPPPGPLPGDVAFISHSGAICAAVVDWARGQSFGLSRLVSLGNQADVSETDVLRPVAADPFTRVLTLYLEGVSDGRRFVSEASQITRLKPIIALKVGRFTSGQRAVASHTGALAGQENAFNAAFRRAGVIRAETSEEVFDWARTLAWTAPPEGRGVAVLTNAGGPGVTAADALESYGLYLSRLSKSTQKELSAILPPAASINNPVDMLASASPEQYAQCLKIILNDPEVHSVMVILPPPPMYTAGAVAKTLIPVIHHSDKPVIIALMGERLIQEAVEHFRAARVPEYRFPERAASALAVLAKRAEYLRRAEQPPITFNEIDKEKAKILLEESMTSKSGGFISQEVAEQLLGIYGISTPITHLARSAEEATRLARQIGFPVALKIASPNVPHKSDVNGVLLGIDDETGVAKGFNHILENVRTNVPKVEIRGVYVQQMAPDGQDVIVGAVQDDQFGPLIMFGSGGIEVEGLKDIAFALAPITAEETEYLLEATWGGRKLGGFRNLKPADCLAVQQAIQRLAQLASDFPEIAEIEINPLRVMGEGQGVLALDVRARINHK